MHTCIPGLTDDCIRPQIHTHTHTHICRQSHTHTHTPNNLHALIHTHTHTYTHYHTHTHTHTHTNTLLHSKRYRLHTVYNTCGLIHMIQWKSVRFQYRFEMK